MNKVFKETVRGVWNKSKYYLLALSLGAYVTTATAGLDEAFQRNFDGMVNVTDPGVYNSQKRGVITGGSFYYRNRIFRTNVVNFQAPSFKAGCGGIDLFGGSFSFINADQFEQLLRNVASNATGYLFEMALTAVCPQCNDILKKLQDTMTELNSMSLNSCEMAKSLVDNTVGPSVKALGSKANQAIKSIVTEKTGSSVVEQVNQGGNGDPTSAGAQAKTLPGGQQALEDIVIGSTTYRALSKQSANTWLTNLGGGGSNSQQTYEMLQSLVGTIVTQTPEDDKLPKSVPKPGIISLERLIAGGSVKIYKCNNSTLCDQVTVEERDIEGTKKIVNRVLFGNAQFPVGGITGGLIEKIYDKFGSGGVSGLTPEEQGLIAASNPGLLSQLKAVMSDRYAMASVAESYASVLSSQIAIRIVNDMIKIVEIAIANEGENFAASDVQAEIANRRRELEAEKENLDKLIEQFNNKVKTVSVIQANLKAINPITLPVAGS